MKLIIAVIGLSFLAACAGKPVIVRVKNCKALGADLYDCEQISKRDYDRK